MSNVFITRSNMQKLEHSAKATKKDISELAKFYNEELERILSNPELELICATKIVLETINESFHLLEVDYSELKIKQSRLPKNARWVYLGGSPAYHLSMDCTKLHQDYLNFEIPSELPESRIEEYRKFFLDNIALFHDDAERFYVRISTKFQLRTSQVRSIQFDNSGFDVVRNSSFNASEVLKMIHEHILKMIEFKNATPEVYKQISALGFATHKAKDYKTNTRFIDLEGDHPVKEWHLLKQKLKGFILDHVIATTNPELAFHQTMLDAAGFSVCKECSNKKTSINLV